jgi:glycosyltransferase involved in cell wall biosynthesis
MIKYSIIVPVYNVEAYLSNCLESVLQQSIPENEYEIIVINDGSPDGSLSIALEFQKKHSNIIVIDQENQGVSVARNRGLEVAQGKYIAFVDPDDEIHVNALPNILQLADTENLDILYLTLDVYSEAGIYIESYEKCGTDGVIQNGFSHPRRTFPATLYRRSVIGATRFVKGIIRGQDTVFNAMVQAKASRCSYCSAPYYKYTRRVSSSRRLVQSEPAFIGFMLAIQTLIDYRKQLLPTENAVQKKYFDTVIQLFCKRILDNNILPNVDKNRFTSLKELLTSNQLAQIVPQLSLEYKHFNSSFTVFYLHHWAKKRYIQLLTIGSKISRSIKPKKP